MKKLLVAFDPADPRSKATDFLVPIVEEGTPRFLGLKSRKFVEWGRSVYTGRDVTMNAVFAKLVETGWKIENADRTKESIEAYLRMLQDHKIGDILWIEASSKEPCGFHLKKTTSDFGGGLGGRQPNLPG